MPDLWRPTGLGAARHLIWRLLDPIMPKPARIVASERGRQLRIVQRHLADLERHGLAVRDGDGWRRGQARPEEVADRLGMTGAGDRDRQRYERERAIYRDLLAQGEVRVRL